MYLDFGFAKNLNEKAVIFGEKKHMTNFPGRKLPQCLIIADGFHVFSMINILKLLHKPTKVKKEKEKNNKTKYPSLHMRT